jgi:hypothetical protein
MSDSSSDLKYKELVKKKDRIKSLIKRELGDWWPMNSPFTVSVIKIMMEEMEFKPLKSKLIKQEDNNLTYLIL